MATPALKTKARTATRPAPEPRLEARVETRTEDRNVIKNRLGEVISLSVLEQDDVDPFAALAGYAPAGWTYEWLRKSVVGWQDPSHDAQLGQLGWTAIPASRHDGIFMPKGHDGPIERGGLIAMERPAVVTAHARQIEAKRAHSQVRHSRALAALMPNTAIADFDSHPDARRLTKVNVERTPVPNNNQYTYAIDE